MKQMTDEEKLTAYKAMQKDIYQKYVDALEKLDRLKSENKTKTVSYRETMGWKYQYKTMLDFYDLYGLRDDE